MSENAFFQQKILRTHTAMATSPIDLIFFSKAYLGTSVWARETPRVIGLVFFSVGQNKIFKFFFFFQKKSPNFFRKKYFFFFKQIYKKMKSENFKTFLEYM